MCMLTFLMYSVIQVTREGFLCVSGQLAISLLAFLTKMSHQGISQGQLVVGKRQAIRQSVVQFCLIAWRPRSVGLRGVGEGELHLVLVQGGRYRPPASVTRVLPSFVIFVAMNTEGESVSPTSIVEGYKVACSRAPSSTTIPSQHVPRQH